MYISRLVAWGRSPRGKSFWLATELFCGTPLDPSDNPQHRSPEVHRAARAALASIHAASVLHGDIAEGNILVSASSQQVCIIDLGLAKASLPEHPCSSNSADFTSEMEQLDDLFR